MQRHPQVEMAIDEQGPLEITHLIAMSPVPDHWAPLPFVIRKVGTREPLFYGLDFFRPLTEEEVDRSLNAIHLEKPITLSAEQGPWLAPGNSVWLAHWEHPGMDPNRTQIGTTLFSLQKHAP